MDEEDVFCLILKISKVVEPPVTVHTVDDNIELLISPSSLFIDKNVSTLIEFPYIER